MRFLTVLFLLINSCGFGASLGPAERAFARKHVSKMQAEFERDGILGVARRTDHALDNLVRRAIGELHKKGEHSYAQGQEDEWNSHFRGVLEAEMSVSGIGDIGDHKPLIQWLENFYNKIEGILGMDLCQALHLSDIKTFNSCIPVAFHPCTFDMGTVAGARQDEYRRHMQKGAIYMGLLPVVTYWACDIGCMFGTAGIAALLCGPIASLAELGMSGPISGKISDAIYNRACGP